MKRHLAIILSFCFASAACSQTYTTELYTEVNPINEEEYSIFQLRGGKPEITKKVNLIIAEEILGLYYEDESEVESIFQDSWPTEDDPIARLWLYEQEVLQLSDRFLSLQFDLEWCGAYCEGATVFKHFDLSNGELITFDQLFNKDQIPAVMEEVCLYKNELKNEYLEELKDSLANNTFDAEEQEYIEAQIEMYEYCECYEEYPQSVSFRLNEEGLFLSLSRCSNHAMRALDELYTFDKVWPRDQWIAYLSPLGKDWLSQ